MVFQAVASLSNRTSLCIGEITTKEAEIAVAEDPAFNGIGVYLIAVDNANPSAPGKILAKFSSVESAVELAQFFRLSGRLEPA